MPSVRNYSNTSSQAALATAQSATDTSIALTGMSGYPAPPFTAAIARGTANEEIVLVTAVNGSTVTVVRGYDGTVSLAQGAGATFQEVVSAVDFSDMNAHVTTSSGAHGTSSPLVGTTDIQTLTNKTLTSPVITNPQITGTASVANLATSGNAAITGTLGAGATTLTGLSVSGATALNTATVVGTPVNSNDVVPKAYADALGVSAATPNTIARRDSVGRLQVVDPLVANDIANKNYVDGKFTDGGWQDLSLAAGWTVRNGFKYRVKNGIVYVAADVTRTGGDLGAGSANVIATLPSGARPSVPYGWAINAATLNVQFGEVLFSSNGQVQLYGSILNGQVLVMATSFPND